MARANRPKFNGCGGVLRMIVPALKGKVRKAAQNYKTFRREARLWQENMHIRLRRAAYRCDRVSIPLG